MEKKRKRTTIIILVSAAVICLFVALSLFLLPNLFPGFPGIRSDELSNIKYVSNCGLGYGDSSELIYGKYYVRRRGSEPGPGHLEIKCLKDHSNDKDYVTYLVFDSAADARKAYKVQYDFIIEYFNERGESGYKKILSKGSNWFVAEMPANDARITQIYYLADNVVMTAYVSVSGYGTTVERQEPKPTTASSISGNQLKNYIIDNASDLRRFVLTEICPKITPGAKR